MYYNKILMTVALEAFDRFIFFSNNRAIKARHIFWFAHNY